MVGQTPRRDILAAASCWLASEELDVEGEEVADPARGLGQAGRAAGSANADQGALLCPDREVRDLVNRCQPVPDDSLFGAR